MHAPLEGGRLLAAATWIVGLLFAGVATGQTVTIHQLPAPPVLDGHGDDWASIPGTVVALHPTKPGASDAPASVLIKGGVHGKTVCFYLEWEDATEDVTHKPWIWNPAKGKYAKGTQREDRLAIQFATGGDYSTDWLSGREFTADMWHWKAFRSNTAGLAHDKSTRITTERALRAYKGVAADGQPLYIARPSDAGDKLYVTRRYLEHEQDVMPKYVVAQAPKGSVADVEAKGIWGDGKWHLELRRKLDTGYADDVVFATGKALLGGIAVFNHTENDDHAISNTLSFQF